MFSPCMCAPYEKIEKNINRASWLYTINQTIMLRARDLFTINTQLPGLINEDAVFEGKNQELSECIKKIELFREKNTYPLGASEYKNGIFHVHVPVNNINVFNWERVIIDLTRDHYAKVAHQILEIMIDENVEERITNYVKKLGMYIHNPIRINQVPITSRKIFELICSSIIDKKNHNYLNMDVFFEFFEKKIAEAARAAKNLVDSCAPQNFLITYDSSLLLTKLFTKDSPVCYFLVRPESNMYNEASSHCHSRMCGIVLPLISNICDGITHDSGVYNSCAKIVLKKKCVVTIINNDLKNSITQNNCVVSIQGFKKPIILPLSEEDLENLNEHEL